MDKIELASPLLEELLNKTFKHHSLRKYLPKIHFNMSADFYQKRTFRQIFPNES